MNNSTNKKMENTVTVKVLSTKEKSSSNVDNYCVRTASCNNKKGIKKMVAVKVLPTKKQGSSNVDNSCSRHCHFQTNCKARITLW